MNAKRILACAALLLGLLSFNAPLSAAVESDVVGYVAVQMEEGKWYEVGCPFVDLNDKEELPLNEVFVSGFSQGDTLCMLDPETSTYSDYLYWIDEKQAWCDRPIAAIAKPSTATLTPGQAVYIHKDTAGQVFLSGKVEAKAAVFGSENGPTWVLVTPIWPETRDVNAYAWEGLTQGDTLTVLDSETGSYADNVYWDEAKGAWCDRPISAIAKPITLELAPGQAVFLNKKTTGVATVTPKNASSANN